MFLPAEGRGHRISSIRLNLNSECTDAPAGIETGLMSLVAETAVLYFMCSAAAALEGIVVGTKQRLDILFCFLFIRHNLLFITGHIGLRLTLLFLHSLRLALFSHSRPAFRPH